jgi:preprotein translocase subunit SecG
MSSRGTTNLLTRTTGDPGDRFFITSLFLSWLAGYDRKPSSIINSTSPAPISQPGSAPQPPVGGCSMR